MKIISNGEEEIFIDYFPEGDNLTVEQAENVSLKQKIAYIFLLIFGPRAFRIGMVIGNFVEKLENKLRFRR